MGSASLKNVCSQIGLATSETAHKIEGFDNIDNSLGNWDGSKTGVYRITLFIFCKSEIIHIKKKKHKDSTYNFQTTTFYSEIAQISNLENQKTWHQWFCHLAYSIQLSSTDFITF